MQTTLRNPTFRHLFAAKIVAQLGTGLAKVALGLLAWRLAGDNARAVLGTAQAIKIGAYVTAPWWPPRLPNACRAGRSSWRLTRSAGA